MTKTLVRVTLYDPTREGDVPARGSIEARPSLRRHIEGDTDYIILPNRLRSKIGAALTYIDNNDVEQTAPATPAVAWLWIDATDDGDYANLWYWNFVEPMGGDRRYCTVPASPTTVDYGDLPDIDPDTYSPTAAPAAGWIAADAALLAGVNVSLGLKAPLASPALTGNPTAPTQATSDNSTKLATTAYVRDSLDDYQPGLEIGHAELQASVSTTATAAGAYIIPGFSIPNLIGKGRPVDVELYVPQVYHSVANTQVFVAFICNGVVSSIRTQVAAGVSPSTARGPSAYAKRRIVLDDGVSYTFTATAWGQVAGTSTLIAFSFENIYMAVTNR